ncbi:XRE family transcriptional regulator [Megamonas rupellensis]|uniref:XRE family transcriptional regulator n=1 Tax=Megamonas rupellensis TaxID=491921 RepID=A0A412CGP9_9FIRM|nr:helix-turn-helix transcriptional regulator [Megamonas rupellensis]RGQ85525.1 XRE family transcriptional regulator [Megamonas rupellensis]
MNTLGINIKEARKKAGLTQMELAKLTNLSRSYIGDIEKDRYNPSLTTLKAIANALNQPLDTILTDNGINNNEPTLTARDEKDIKKKLDEALASIDSEALMFDGEPVEMDTETKELLKASLENSIRLAKTLAKKKYTPKKYQKNDKSDD